MRTDSALKGSRRSCAWSTLPRFSFVGETDDGDLGVYEGADAKVRVYCSSSRSWLEEDARSGSRFAVLRRPLGVLLHDQQTTLLYPLNEPVPEAELEERAAAFDPEAGLPGWVIGSSGTWSYEKYDAVRLAVGPVDTADGTCWEWTAYFYDHHADGWSVAGESMEDLPRAAMRAAHRALDGGAQ